MGFGPLFEIPHLIDTRQEMVVMRPAQDGDAAHLARLLSDDSVRRFTFLQAGRTAEDEEKYFEQIEASKRQVLWVISIRDAKSEKVIGTTALKQVRGRRYSSTIVLADQRYWGKGVAKLTHRFRTWYAFRELGALALVSSYMEPNIASGKALKSVGYVEYGRNWRAYLTDERWHDEILMVCYNPLGIAKLWPDGNLPPVVHDALPKTEAALANVHRLLEPG